MKKILIVATILLFAAGCGCDKINVEEKVEYQVKINTNEDIIKDQVLEVFTFTNTSLTYQGNTSLLVTEVTNTSAETQYLEEFKIHVWDYNKNEIVEMTGFIGDSIEPNETKIINSSYGEDLTYATSITYEIVR